MNHIRKYVIKPTPERNRQNRWIQILGNRFNSILQSCHSEMKFLHSDEKQYYFLSIISKLGQTSSKWSTTLNLY